MARGKSKKAQRPPLAPSAREWLEKADDDFLTCRGQRHRFPLIHDGMVPAGADLERTPEGAYQLIMDCSGNCGAELTITTGPGGLFDENAKRQIRYTDPDYLVPKGLLPPGTRIPPTAAFNLSVSRLFENLGLRANLRP